MTAARLRNRPRADDTSSPRSLRWIEYPRSCPAPRGADTRAARQRLAAPYFFASLDCTVPKSEECAGGHPVCLAAEMRDLFLGLSHLVSRDTRPCHAQTSGRPRPPRWLPPNLKVDMPSSSAPGRAGDGPGDCRQAGIEVSLPDIAATGSLVAFLSFRSFSG
jgi:hypothetical protein